jgi:hypothetical protein
MTSEPISTLPSGNPADAIFLVQSTGSGGITQKISLLQLFNYISEKSISNILYVDSANGIDSLGRGSSLAPYASISYALSQITNHSFVTLLQCFGDFTETNLSFPINCYIYGNNSTLTVTNQVTADATWAAASGWFILKDFVNLNFSAGMLLDISAATFGVVRIQQINCNTTELFKIKGNGDNTGTGIYVFDNIFGFSSIPSIEIENCYGGIFGGAPVNLTIKNTSTVNDYVSTIESIQILGDLLLDSSSGRILNINKTDVYVNGAFTINGTGVQLNSDESNVIPTLTGGATLSQITYRNLSDTLSAGFTPTGYTPTDDQVKGHLEGINNEFNVGGSRIPFGGAGGGIISDSAFTYDVANKRLAVNNIRALSANIAGLNGSGFTEFNSAVDVSLTNNSPFGPYTKIHAVFTATGKKIILPDSTEPFAIQSSNGGSIEITNQSPTISFGVQTFLGDLIYTIRPLETVNIWITDNPSGSYFVEKINEDFSYIGSGYHEINDGVSLTLTNPMYTVINVTDAGSGLAIRLSDMTENNAPQSSKLPAFYIFNNGSQQVDVLYKSGANLTTIYPQQYFVFFVTSNSTSDGTFYFQSTPNFKIGSPLNSLSVLFLDSNKKVSSTTDLQWDDTDKTLTLLNSTAVPGAGLLLPNPNSTPTPLDTYTSPNFFIVNASGPWSTRTVQIRFTRIGDAVHLQLEDIASAAITATGNKISIPGAVPPAFRAAHNLSFPIKIYYGAANTDLASGDLYINSSTGDILITVLNNQVFNAGFAGLPEGSVSWLVS